MNIFEPHIEISVANFWKSMMHRLGKLTSWRYDIGFRKFMVLVPPAARPTEFAVGTSIRNPRWNKSTVLTAFNNNSPIVPPLQKNFGFCCARRQPQAFTFISISSRHGRNVCENENNTPQNNLDNSSTKW